MKGTGEESFPWKLTHESPLVPSPLPLVLCPERNLLLPHLSLGVVLGIIISGPLLLLHPVWADDCQGWARINLHGSLCLLRKVKPLGLVAGWLHIEVGCLSEELVVWVQILRLADLCSGVFLKTFLSQRFTLDVVRGLLHCAVWRGDEPWSWPAFHRAFIFTQILVSQPSWFILFSSAIKLWMVSTKPWSLTLYSWVFCPKIIIDKTALRGLQIREDWSCWTLFVWEWWMKKQTIL